MSTWSEASRPATVLRGGAALAARPARMDAELRTTPFAPSYAVDARLTDPHLEQVVARARAAAQQEGWAQGRAEGYAAGRQAAAEEAAVAAAETARRAAVTEQQRDEQVRVAVELLATAAEAFRRRDAVAVAEVEDVVAHLAVEVARAVLGRELALSDDPGRDALARALALAPEDTPATVRLHPDDAAALGAVDDLAAGRPLVVVPDPTVERGGCVVDAAGRQVDAQVGPALARVAAALR